MFQKSYLPPFKSHGFYKPIAFRSAQEKAKKVESYRDDEEDELSLLIKNILKKGENKQTKSGFSSSKASKSKTSFKPLNFCNKKCV